MPTFDELRTAADQRKLIRKVQKYVGFIAPKTVQLPETLFTAPGTLVDLATDGWLPLGMCTPDGWSYTREMTKTPIPALGYATPPRSDVTELPRTVGATLLEKYRKHVQEMLYGTDLSSATQDQETGEVVFDEPDMPMLSEYRLLLIGTDGPTVENWVMGLGFHAVELATGGGETWGQEGAVSTEISFDVRTDDETGTPVRHYFGGTGALLYAEDLGYEAGTTP